LLIYDVICLFLVTHHIRTTTSSWDNRSRTNSVTSTILETNKLVWPKILLNEFCSFVILGNKCKQFCLLGTILFFVEIFCFVKTLCFSEKFFVFRKNLLFCGNYCFFLGKFCFFGGNSVVCGNFAFCRIFCFSEKI
jgi:hypothetical protein